MQRPLHTVSCKAMIFDPTKQYVLVTRYTAIKSGLPGGHLEYSEAPDEAIRRELQEEIGIIPHDIARKDFFVTSESKVILGFEASLSLDHVFNFDPVEIANLDWVLVDDIRRGVDSAGQYDEMIVKCA